MGDGVLVAQNRKAAGIIYCHGGFIPPSPCKGHYLQSHNAVRRKILRLYRKIRGDTGMAQSRHPV
jgi:hypothetical protein